MINSGLIEVETETLFKVEEPITALKSGFGFKGVVTVRKDDGRLQCHICGEWFENLSYHAYRFHKMKSETYKKRFSLPLSYGLVCKRVSEAYRKNCIKNGYKALKKIDSRSLRKNKRLPHWKYIYSKANEAYKNINGACNEQLASRYLSVCDKVGKTASAHEVMAHDNSLWMHIKRRYKTFNRFKKAHGFGNVIKRNPSLSKYKLINDLREFFDLKKKLPHVQDFSNDIISASRYQYCRNFGSMRKAYVIAGLLK